jgi:hypothetical protein
MKFSAQVQAIGFMLLLVQHISSGTESLLIKTYCNFQSAGSCFVV